MSLRPTLRASLIAASALFAQHGAAQSSGGAATVDTLPTLYIGTQETANLRPVTTFETPVSNLEFDPRIDLQSRNMAEAQGDVTLRGGIFENTGFSLGAATVFDPQTGHYFAELPLAPEMLAGPEVLTGTENALYGFNSTVGTIQYDFRRIAPGGSLTAAAGDHDLNMQRLHHAVTGDFPGSKGWSWGLEAELSRSESGGTLPDGDHRFERASARLQLLGPVSQTDFVLGYQAKRFRWPGMYTGDVFLDFPDETEDLNTRLFLVNHRRDYAEGSWLEATAYHRRHSDRYFLVPFNSENIHETQVEALGLAGRHAFGNQVALNYASQATGDSIESTSLTIANGGEFTSRSYLNLSLLPEYRLVIPGDRSLTFRAGLTWDDSNRDEAATSFLGDVTFRHTGASGSSETVYLSFAQSSQVPGYTAIVPGNPLFAGDPDLKRERSENLELGARIERREWSLEAAVFYRSDDDLVDWTFTGGTFARSAENVSIDTFGTEWIATRRWENLEAVAGYTYLHKDEQFENAAVIGSFYALNYPEHRATLGLLWQPLPSLELRIDNEWRRQEANPLRSRDDAAFFTHLAISYFPPAVEGLELFAAVDNLWEDDFQEVPGTPGRGDQYSAGLSYHW